MSVTEHRIDARPGWRRLRAAAGPHLPALAVGAIAVALMLTWAADNGGYDTSTWYWGALTLLGVLGCVTILRFRRPLARPTLVALAALAAYVAWSYLSIAWAQAPGLALEGSNRALMYLILFALMTTIPWTDRSAAIVLVTFVCGVGVIALVLLLRLASATGLSHLLLQGRLLAPTGYVNSNAALFTLTALMGVALATRRELPGVVRGLLVASACASLQLAVMAQSRGWLFTLPLILLVTICVVRDRLRFIGFAVMPVAATLVIVHRLTGVFGAAPGTALAHAARIAGQSSLVLCTIVFVLATLVAWTEQLLPRHELSGARRRALGVILAIATIGAGAAGVVAATHGHPVAFVRRQWQGFSHPPQANAHGSYFNAIGSNRYDFWRVALDATKAHPIGGLGQDNFGDYYVKRRRSTEEPSWAHSLELQLLASTGVVGFALFAAFAAAALTAAWRAHGLGSPLRRALAGAAMLPFAVWIVHGSVDWFWEMPAVSGPALGFLGLAAAAGPEIARQSAAPRARTMRTRAVAAVAGAAFLAAVAALALPYLATREMSLANAADPTAALRDLQHAADLNPLDAVAPLTAGELAMNQGQWLVARQRFAESINRDPGSWFAWLGSGLASSGLGDRDQAYHDFNVAYSINNQQPPVRAALARAKSAHPLSYDQAIRMLNVAP
jgi:tetratricopeptide (TPR) repeat protein